MPRTVNLNGAEYVLLRAFEPGADRADMFDSRDSAAFFFGRAARDPWNMTALRSLLAEEMAGASVSSLSDDDVVELLAELGAGGHFAVGRIEHRSGGAGGAAAAATDEAAPAAAPAKPKERIPLDSLKVLEVTFKSDHAKLKDNDKDWVNSGKPYPEPEWKKGAQNHPISHTMDQEISLEVKIEVGPASGEAQGGKLIGRGPGDLKFEKKFQVTPGQSTHSLKSTGKLPKKIHKLEESIDWSLELDVDGRLSGGASGAHRIYVTYDKPRDDAGSRQEDGVTIKRMDRAMEWVEPLGTLWPHEIVDPLMRKFRGYVLAQSPNVPEKYGHPSFMGQSPDQGGAWPLSDYVDETGECQAIVRLVRGVIRQVGIPGEAKIFVVWAEPNADDASASTKEADWEQSPHSGLDTSKAVSGRMWYAALVDGFVQEGKWYPPSHNLMKDGKYSPGLNRYEACLKFTAPDKATGKDVTVYYGGGAGAYDSMDDVIRAFKGLIWVTIERPKPDDHYYEDKWMDPSKKKGYRVQKIVKKYRAGPW